MRSVFHLQTLAWACLVFCSCSGRVPREVDVDALSTIQICVRQGLKSVTFFDGRKEIPIAPSKSAAVINELRDVADGNYKHAPSRGSYRIGPAGWLRIHLDSGKHFDLMCFANGELAKEFTETGILMKTLELGEVYLFEEGR